VTIPAPVVPRAPAAGDPRDVESLYQRGVEHYARGEYLEASAMFLRILQIDPSNEQATKALARIQRMRPGQ
jgi:tetratricopeptide (TPR) repeat protein